MYINFIHLFLEVLTVIREIITNWDQINHISLYRFTKEEK
jgi:hypothetical protein